MPRHIFSFFSLALLISLALPQQARAGCYDDVGCTEEHYLNDFDLSLLSCEKLDFLRNSIYAENGYCFKQSKYRRIFGTDECRFDRSGEVPVSRIERANIHTILRVESENGCPG